MTTETLAKLMREMRAAQKEYFKTRRQSDLQKSKQLEAEMDLLLSRIPEHKSVIQKQLFT